MRGPGPKSRGNLRCYLTPYYYSCSTCWTTSSPSLPAPAQSGILQRFSPDLVKLVRSLSLDSWPASLFKDVFQSIGPCVLAIISTASGKVLLKKKAKFDSSLLSSYRRISKLVFITKKSSRPSSSQQFQTNSVRVMFQSDFRRAHSTETARRRVCSDIFMHHFAWKRFYSASVGPHVGIWYGWPPHAAR